MKMLKMLLVTLAVSATAAAFGAAYTFPENGGDIAIDGSWATGTLPSSSDVVKFSKNGEYTASDDVEFAAMTVTAQNATFDFTVLGDADPRSVKIKRLEAYKPGQVLTFKGGVIDLQGGPIYQCAKDKNKSGGGQLMEFTGCAVVTNVGVFRVSYRDTNNTVRLSNASKLYVDEFYWDYGEGVSNAVEVLSGSELVVYSYLRDSFYNKAENGTDTMSRILVSGEGSKLICLYTKPVSGFESLSLGSVYAGGSLTVAEGAIVTNAGQFVMGKGIYGNNTTLSLLSGGLFNEATDVLIGNAPGSYGHEIKISGDGSKMTVAGNLKMATGAGSCSNRVEITDGGELNLSNETQETQVSSGANSFANEIVISNGGKMTVAGMLKLSIGTGSCSNRIEITDGGELNLSNETQVSSGANSFANEIVISNGGKMTVAGNLKMATGAGSCSNRVEITDGGELNLSKETYVSSGANSFANEIIISNGGKLTGGQALRLVDASTAHDNRVEVLDSGEAYFSMFYLGGYSGNATKGGFNNTLIVSNAVFNCTRFVFGMADSAISNKVFVTGPESQFRTSYNMTLFLFGLGRCHEMVLDDGANWSYPQTIYLDANACSNRLVVTRNATLNIARALISGTNTLSHSQYVEVSDGAKLEVGDDIFITRSGNEFVVSNATVIATNHIYIGCSPANVADDAVFGNSLTIAGTNPVVRVVDDTAKFKVDYNSVLRIVLPETGYADGIVPISAANEIVLANGKSQLEIEGILEMRRCYGRTKSRYTLMSAGIKLNVPNSIVEAVNAKFLEAGAADCCVYKTDDNKLMLKVPLAKGSIFCIR